MGSDRRIYPALDGVVMVCKPMQRLAHAEQSLKLKTRLIRCDLKNGGDVMGFMSDKLRINTVGHRK